MKNICHLVLCALCIIVSGFWVMQRSFFKCVLVTPMSYFGCSEETARFNFPFFLAVDLLSGIVQLVAMLSLYIALFTLDTFYDTW